MAQSEYYTIDRSEMLDFLPNLDGSSRVIEIGCGDANFLHKIKSQYGCECWGVEPYLLDKNSIYIHSSVDRFLGVPIEDALDSIPINYFDLIILNDVIEHLQDPETILSGLKSRLTENGVILMSVPNFLFYGNVFEILVLKDFKYKDFGILDRTHLRFYTRKSLIETLENNDFKIINLSGINQEIGVFYWLLNIFSFGYFRESKFLQFAVLVKNNGT